MEKAHALMPAPAPAASARPAPTHTPPTLYRTAPALYQPRASHSARVKLWNTVQANCALGRGVMGNRGGLRV
eukprot:886992-Rhodomonas_salina.3